VSASPRHPPNATRTWLLLGGLLLALHAALLWISHEFPYGRPVLERPTGWLVALLMCAGAVYLFAVLLLKRLSCAGARWWWGMLGAGLLMRLLMLASTPMLETDYFRYLWDGAVVAHGHNPYRHAPATVLAGDAPEALHALARESGGVLNRVNHPDLRTIYPPVAQCAFALAHQVKPWEITGLRLVWLLCDTVTLLLLIALLRALALPRAAVLIYWWNPLLIKEAYNSAHMELLLLPFVTGAVLLAVRGRLVWAAGALALGAGVKLWPLLLLPVLLRQRGFRWQRAAVAAGVFAACSALLVLPLLLSALGAASGLHAYAEHWQMNDSLYKLIHLAAAGIAPAHAHFLARGVVALLLLAWMAWLCRKPTLAGRETAVRALWVIAALFLLSPTQFPWYWLWLLPLLAVQPSPGLLVLTATLPLYYLRFPMRELGLTSWFDHGVVWLQFLPALLLLAWEARRPHPR